MDQKMSLPDWVFDDIPDPIPEGWVLIGESILLSSIYEVPVTVRWRKGAKWAEFAKGAC